MFTVITGLVVAAIGAGLTYNNLSTSNDVTIMMWAQAVLALGAGLGIAGWNSVDLVKSLMTKVKSNINSTSTDSPVETIKMKTEEEKDIESLFYLTERCKDSPEGLELCQKINSLLFSLHHKKE